MSAFDLISCREYVMSLSKCFLKSGTSAMRML